jgi:hypothetical protein
VYEQARTSVCAPSIGFHVVTVVGAEPITVNIETTITYADGWSWDDCASQITKAVDDFFLELSKGWDDENDTTIIIRMGQLESRILDCDGVVDISDTKLNGSTNSLYLTTSQIPIRGLINGK